MKINSSLYRIVITRARQLAKCAAVGLLTYASHAQSWQTVLDYQYAPDRSAQGTGLATDPTGTLIYAAGYAADASWTWHAIALKSSDAGATWSFMDDYVTPDNPGYAGIAVDVHGNIYAAGAAFPSGGAAHWFVRRSVDDGLTWATIDDVALGGDPVALTTDAAGNVYVVGEGFSNSRTWIVRKGTVGNAGITWANVDSFSTGGANTVLATSTGLFVGGVVKKKGGGNVLWTVRRSANGGGTWNTVDSFSLAVNQNAYANSLAADSSGIYSAGLANKSVKATTVSDWIVRRSTDGGNSWATIDDAGPNCANALGADSQGNHYVAGLGPGGWAVRENLANTSTWSTVDTFQYAGYAAALIGDGSAHVFAAGYIDTADQIDHWIIRKR